MIRWTLAEYAGHKGLTRSRIARTSGLSEASVSRIWRNLQEPRPHTLNALCGALACDPGDLLRHVGDSSPAPAHAEVS